MLMMVRERCFVKGKEKREKQYYDCFETNNKCVVSMPNNPFSIQTTKHFSVLFLIV